MILTIKKKHNLPLIVDTDKMTGFKESGSGYNITFGDETYYFSLEDAIYMINQLFPNELITIKKSTNNKTKSNLFYKGGYNLMANTKNLKSNSERTPKERQALAKKAGRKSGEVRRERKQLKEELLLLLSTGDLQKRISIALIKKAIAGDIRAFETIRDTIGEKPTEKVFNITPPVIIDDI